MHVVKQLTTPDDPERSVLEGVERVLARRRGSTGGERSTRVVHGTTLATNAVIERQGARVAFVTTEGFRRPSCSIGREARVEDDRYDLLLRARPSAARPTRRSSRCGSALNAQLARFSRRSNSTSEQAREVAKFDRHVYAPEADRSLLPAFLRGAAPTKQRVQAMSRGGFLPEAYAIRCIFASASRDARVRPGEYDALSRQRWRR